MLGQHDNTFVCAARGVLTVTVAHGWSLKHLSEIKGRTQSTSSYILINRIYSKKKKKQANKVVPALESDALGSTLDPVAVSQCDFGEVGLYSRICFPQI